MFDLGFLSLCIREEKPKQNTPVVKTNKQKTRKPSSVKCIIAQHSRLCFWGSQEAARVFRQELECLLWSRRVNADITSAQRSSQSALVFPESPQHTSPGFRRCGVQEKTCHFFAFTEMGAWLLGLFWPSLCLGDFFFMPWGNVWLMPSIGDTPGGKILF